MRKEKIALPDIVPRKEWIDKRRKLLKKEKELTRARDQLNAERRRMPMVEITKDYKFESPDGKKTLLDLFEDRKQLIVYHFMFDPKWDEGCGSCSTWADHIARGHFNHLHIRSTTLALISRAPLSKIMNFKNHMNWEIPWYSSYDSDFNYDFHVTLDESVAPVEYNYRDQATLEHLGLPTEGELPGLSCFLRNGNSVNHTYSTYGRGVETVGGAYYFLDLTALGRQEEWEEPKER